MEPSKISVIFAYKYRRCCHKFVRYSLIMFLPLLTVSVVFWCMRNALALDHQHAPKPSKPSDIMTYDVAIIGGGSSGTHAAISLKDKGKTVIVVEKQGRLGGHTETYTDPSTGIAQDYGVQVWHNISTVREYFQRFDVPLTTLSFGGNSGPDYDLRTGKKLNINHPSQEEVGAALSKYAAFLSQYPEFDLGRPIPKDLLITFGDFVKKYGIEAVVQTFFVTNQGAGDLLSLPVVEIARVVGLDLVQQLATNGLLTTARHNNSEIYGKAQAELLGDDSLLLSSEVTQSKRLPNRVELVVKTPNGDKLIRAKKLLITIPPRLDLLRSFDLQHQEQDVFSKMIDTGYYAAVVKNTGIPDDISITNYAPETPYNLPPLPGVYGIQSSAIPGVKVVYYGSQKSSATYPLSDATVKADIISSIKSLQAANPEFDKTEPEFVVYTSHAPFYLQAPAEETKAGFYDKLYALQGLKSTYWSGAAFKAQDSSLLWRFNEKVVLPMLMKEL
jgi:hypothetical protein